MTFKYNYQPAAECIGLSSESAKLDCIARAIAALQTGLEPVAQPPIETWPGNQACVSCHFFAGIAVGLVELGLLYFLANSFIALFRKAEDESFYSKLGNKLNKTESKSLLCCILGVFGLLLSVLGWLYYLLIVAFFWNFISYLMTSGLFVLAPGWISTYLKPASAERTAALNRRLKLAGWVLGLICLIMFPNVARFPQQLYRRVYPSETVILPDDPLVIQLREQFFQQLPEKKFNELSFTNKMIAVDEFIKNVIIWKSDMSQYGLIGLLTTAHEVIERHAGDCQGQAATTVSLLLSMGYQAWVVETPFHWWTHAYNNYTGEYYNLNSHGSAATEGSVNPQPIDFVYTRPAPACVENPVNCTYVDAHNVSPTLYMAPPHLAFAIALTGSHIFVRSNVTYDTVNWISMITTGLELAVLVAFYATYFQGDSFLNLRVLFRFLFAAVICVVFVFIFLVFWVTIFYPVALLHLVFTIGFVFNYTASNTFNAAIGSPILL